MNLQHLRIGVGILAITFATALLYQLFQAPDLSWANNRSSYILIISQTLVAMASLLSYWKVKAEDKTSTHRSKRA